VGNPNAKLLGPNVALAAKALLVHFAAHGRDAVGGLGKQLKHLGQISLRKGCPGNFSANFRLQHTVDRFARGIQNFHAMSSVYVLDFRFSFTACPL
jgi:hypothetical protein